MRKWFLPIALLYLLSSCERSLMPDDPGSSSQANFESLVETVGNKYSLEVRKLEIYNARQCGGESLPSPVFVG